MGTVEGYEIVERAVSHFVCDKLLEALQSSGAGRRHLLAVPEVGALARSPKLTRIARNWLGGTAIPFRATLHDKSAGRIWFVAWHQDATLPLERRIEGGEWKSWTLKSGLPHARAPAWALERIVALRLHLDDSTPENGPLRVIPGSHRRGLLSPEAIRRVVGFSVAVECLASRGGVLALRPLLLHASSKAASPSPRRVIHIEYADSLELAPGVSLAVS